MYSPRASPPASPPASPLASLRRAEPSLPSASTRTLSADARVVEPLPLWGSHEAEDWLASYAREMGVASCQVVRLRPRLVAIAAVEQGKLRALMRNLSVKTGGA